MSRSDEPSDLDLLARWRDGDESAGEHLLARHFDAVCRFFRNKAGEAAPDLIQQTFLACCEGRDKIRDESAFRSYLFGVARFVLIGHYKARRAPGARVDPLVESVVALGEPGASSVLGRRREENLLLQALRTLPVDLQIAFELYHLEGMTARELGEMYGLSEPGMYGRLRKARTLIEAQIRKLTSNPELRQSTLSGLEDWAQSIRTFLDK